MKTNPDTLKVLVALAKNLRASAKNRREKESMEAIKSPNTINNSLCATMAFQARAMHHALYNAFYLAKKAAERI